MLVSSVLIFIAGMSKFATLDVSISGDGIPNRPQQGPSLEYPWSQVILIIVIVGISAMTALYSLYKIFHRPGYLGKLTS